MAEHNENSVNNGGRLADSTLPPNQETEMFSCIPNVRKMANHPHTPRPTTTTNKLVNQISDINLGTFLLN